MGCNMLLAKTTYGFVSVVPWRQRKWCKIVTEPQGPQSEEFEWVKKMANFDTGDYSSLQVSMT